MRHFFVSILGVVLSLTVSAQPWLPDTLGDGFEMRHIDQGHDYSGPVRSTIVRHLSPYHSGKGVLYIHGFNDYFFQAEMANEFTARHYDFYAVDLRKYGRSLTVEQKRCQVRSLDEYFPDIDSALVSMRDAGCRDIVLMGHSTGGLIAAYYMARHPLTPINALVLNSPFLDWNLGKKERYVNLVSFIGRIFPNLKITQDDSTAYGESLLKEHHGEWTFNTEWKTKVSPDVDAGWVRAINTAQHYLRKHKGDIHVPILLMYSSRSLNISEWNSEANSADIVLDVADIYKYGM